MARIAIITDAWLPQVNGVVRTLQETGRALESQGHEVRIIGPDLSRWWCCQLPTYPDIKLELFAFDRLNAMFSSFKPDYIHIATEGPLGWTMRNLCILRRVPFTTSYHTRFPEYFGQRSPHWAAPFIQFFAYRFFRHFHRPSKAVMAATSSTVRDLRARHFRRVVRWSRGVDTNLFCPRTKDIPTYHTLPRPILLYVGRLSVEKNLVAFLDTKTLGTKVLIGDGPDGAKLKAQYPNAHFLGPMQGEVLAAHYAAADLFVFPSKTETFGLVLLEAAASGLRIASYPSPGPVDIFDDGETSRFVILNENLQMAIDQALVLPAAPQAARAFAEKFSWQSCTEVFLTHLKKAPAKK